MFSIYKHFKSKITFLENLTEVKNLYLEHKMQIKIKPVNRMISYEINIKQENICLVIFVC